MPRTKFDERNERYSKVVELIWGRMVFRGMSESEMAEKLGVSPATAARRRHSPENFTLGEITKIGRALNIPIDDLRAAIRY